MLQIAVWCLVVTALLSYVNNRFIGLPTSIGVMTIALCISMALIGLDKLGFSAPHTFEVTMMQSIDFTDVLMQGMLSLLLFASGLHVDLNRLRTFRWPIGILAFIGTTITAILVGLALWKLLPLVSIHLPLGYCLAFGALISPTDAVAVAGILKSSNTPKNLEAVISGESLFNDAVGVVLFALALVVINTGQLPGINRGLLLLAQEGGGGILLGLAIGYGLFYMLRGVDSPEVEILLTLAAVMAGYGVADQLHFSGPLTAVVMGITFNSKASTGALAQTTQEHLSRFWTLIDSLLNTVLFVLIGLEITSVNFQSGIFVAAILTIIITLLARAISIATPMMLFKKAFNLPSGSWQLLTWAGLRGGVSVALALSLPKGDSHIVNSNTVLSLTYCVVIFSILGQGLTISKVAQYTTRPTAKV